MVIPSLNVRYRGHAAIYSRHRRLTCNPIVVSTSTTHSPISSSQSLIPYLDCANGPSLGTILSTWRDHGGARFGIYATCAKEPIACFNSSFSPFIVDSPIPSSTSIAACGGSAVPTGNDRGPGAGTYILISDMLALFCRLATSRITSACFTSPNSTLTSFMSPRGPPLSLTSLPLLSSPPPL